MELRCDYLARLSSSEQKHLNLVFSHHAVFFQLALDLVIPCDWTAKMSLDVREKRRRERLTGFCLGIDGRGLYATHFDKLLQRLEVIKQEAKERAGLAGGQRVEWVSM